MEPGLAERLERTFSDASATARSARAAARLEALDYTADARSRAAMLTDARGVELESLRAGIAHRADISVRGIHQLCRRLDAAASLLRAGAGRG
jgi:hypothetical protein